MDSFDPSINYRSRMTPAYFFKYFKIPDNPLIRFPGEWFHNLAHTHYADTLVRRSDPHLTTLGKSLYVEGLALLDCHNLRELPYPLFSDGHVTLDSCSGLKKLPNHMVVVGDLYINDCSLYIPSNIIVTGRISGEYKIISNSVNFILDI